MKKMKVVGRGFQEMLLEWDEVKNGNELEERFYLRMVNRLEGLVGLKNRIGREMTMLGRELKFG